MRRGTTPTHTISTDISLVSAEVIYITYEQNGKIVLEKTKDEISVTEQEITIPLTQEETLAFDTDYKVYIQIRARFATGQAVGSNIMHTSVERILKGGVI